MKYTFKKILTKSLIALALLVIIYIVYFIQYSWSGTIPNRSTSETGWSEKNGILVSDTIPYYLSGSNIIMDENINFIRNDKYCSLWETLGKGNIEYFKFYGQLIKLNRKCYKPSKISVWSPTTEKGKAYIIALLKKGNNITLKITHREQDFIDTNMTGMNPVVFSSKGYNEILFNKTNAGQKLIKEKQIYRLKEQNEKEKKWKEATDNAL